MVILFGAGLALHKWSSSPDCTTVEVLIFNLMIRTDLLL